MNKSEKPFRRKGGYVLKWEEVLASPAYRDLKPVERCLLEELQRLYRPNRNGRISLSVRRASELVRANKDTVTKAFVSLTEHGFIELIKGEYWQDGKAREWRITFEPNSNGREPTDEWKSWEPNKKMFHLSRKNSKTRSHKEGHFRPQISDRPSEPRGHPAKQPTIGCE